MSEFNPHDDAAASEPEAQPSACFKEATGTPVEPSADANTATCLCGEFKLSFSTHVIKSFICHCHTCRKETASMFATSLLVPQDSDFVIDESTPNIRTFTMTADSGNDMTSRFCGTCGSTMYRTSSGFPGVVLIPQGVVDGAELRDRKLEVEQWTCRRVAYLGGLPFTEKFVRGWNPMGEGREEEGGEEKEEEK